MAIIGISSRSRAALGGLALFMAGSALGAGGYALIHHPAADWSGVARTAIAQLQADSAVEIDGRVTERFGNRFVLADPSGHALVDIGPRENMSVALNEILRVRGRFDDGVLHAAELIHANGVTDRFDPPRALPPRDRVAACAPLPAAPGGAPQPGG